jgi:hypothetical protein
MYRHVSVVCVCVCARVRACQLVCGSRLGTPLRTCEVDKVWCLSGSSSLAEMSCAYSQIQPAWKYKQCEQGMSRTRMQERGDQGEGGIMECFNANDIECLPRVGRRAGRQARNRQGK